MYKVYKRVTHWSRTYHSMSLHGYLGIFLDTRTDIWWLARSFFAVLDPASMMLFGFLGRHRELSFYTVFAH